MPDWKKIKAEYIRGGASIRILADKYGVSSSTLSKRARREKWTDLRTKSGQKVASKMVESVASQEAKSADRLQHVTDLLLQRIEEGIEDGSLLGSQSSIRSISGALRDIREIKGYKSDLDIQEQMARIEKLRKEAAIEDKQSEIHVVIAPDLEDYGG